MEICILILVIVSYSNCNSENIRVKRAANTGGQGCDALSVSFSRRPIPGTYLETGVFYSIKMKYSSGSGSDDSAYITWDWVDDFSNPREMNVIADFSNIEQYEKGGEWYSDSHWAFLATEDPDWYHLINCGYPCKYATWKPKVDDVNDEYSNEEKNNIKGYPMIIDPHYPGNQSKEDFLFRPVLALGQSDYDAEVEGEDHAYQLITMSHNIGIVFYYGNGAKDSEGEESEVLRIGSNETWLESGGSLKSSLFTFHSTVNGLDGNQESIYEKSSDNNNFVVNPLKMGLLCSCELNIVFAVLLILWAVGMTIFGFIQTKRIQKIGTA